MNCEPKNERYMPHKIEPPQVAASALGDTELFQLVERIASTTNIGLLDEYKGYLRECAMRMKERGRRLKEVAKACDAEEAKLPVVGDMRDCADRLSISSPAISSVLRIFADDVEAALKRSADRIHRAMVLIAGIEMEDSENPPRLWTALEDAYDALSDALGTDGCISADIEEAKAIGRHFVVKSFGNADKMLEALNETKSVATKRLEAVKLRRLVGVAKDALNRAWMYSDKLPHQWPLPVRVKAKMRAALDQIEKEENS